jgi:carbon storage regulator
MLLLNRYTCQSIILHTLDGTIEVTVTQIKDGQVKLGIDAPPEVLILRKEIDSSYLSPAKERAQ